MQLRSTVAYSIYKQIVSFEFIKPDFVYVDRASSGNLILSIN